MPQDMLPEPPQVSPKRCSKCASTRVGKLPVPACLASWASFWLYCLVPRSSRCFPLLPGPLVDLQMPQHVLAEPFQVSLKSTPEFASPSLGTPPRPACLASWTTFWLCCLVPGSQCRPSSPAGCQLDTNWTVNDANWTPSECHVGLPKRLPVSTYALRTPKQLHGALV